MVTLGRTLKLILHDQRSRIHLAEIKMASNIKSANGSSFLKEQIISFFQPSDNKLAMKLFGNKKALMKEKMRQQEAGNWIIHPCSNFSLIIKEKLKKIKKNELKN
ncbi:hypothetical protein HELRODRAFT_159613 [Helobdella robusta]|uniref:Ion transport N-terminal domain-containing protein n=1 Tax=Helobdella robusta TaxID=6412 RepID=T1EP87_HELRO|nr:hypothetical protein HELRODRAFT_159613 [Helobdella robusta]ESO13016.1 hypothetical protein HELRODRAFT_159613 [Helobdella robusta]